MTLLTATLTRPITRAHHCLDCKKSLPKSSPRLCQACTESRERMDAADHYRVAILAMIEDDSNRWQIATMLNRLILHSKFHAPLILQAVLDRSAWLSPLTYSGVCDIARNEAEALGFNFPIF